VKVFVLDAHAIYRRGLTACLAGVSEVCGVSEAGGVGEAWKNPDLLLAEMVLIDPDMPGGIEFIRQVRESGDTLVVVCSESRDEQDVLAAVQAGAVGYLCKETLSPESLAAGISAARSGAGVMPPDLLGSLLRGITRVSREVLEPRGLSLTRLSEREQQVLRLVAEGHPTREVAERLCYSERTIKNVIHDVVTKLNVRTRSQAVARAVREGMI